MLDDQLKVAYGNNTSFAEYYMTFWLALQSCFRKLSIQQKVDRFLCLFQVPRIKSNLFGKVVSLELFA